MPKICPLRHFAADIRPPGPQLVDAPCRREGCAWYVVEDELCVLVVLALVSTQHGRPTCP